MGSCAPGALWQDSGLIQYRIWHNDTEGSLGLALSHPLFYILAIGAKYVLLGEFPHRVNLVSAIAAAAAVANMFLFVRLWLGRILPAVVAAVTLALAHTFWRHASVIETYTLWTALFLGELIMLLQYTRTETVRWLYWLGLLSGLSLAVHMLASIPLLCYVVFFAFLLSKRKIRVTDLAIIILLCIVGALPYEYLIIKNMMQTGDVLGTLASAAFGDRWQGAVLNTSLSMKIVKENLLYIALNFPTPNVLLFFCGFFALFKVSLHRGLRNVLLGLTVLFFLFAFRYTVPDRYAFFLPFYCMASILIGLGVYLLQEQVKRRVLAFGVVTFSLVPVGVYAAAPALAEQMRLDVGTRDDIPYRDDNEYFLRPWKRGYTGADRFAAEALDLVADDAVIYADITTVGPLLLAQQVRGKRPDVKIISGTLNSEEAPRFDEHAIGQLLADRSVYVVSPKPGYCPAFILEDYDLVRTGILWRLTQAKRTK
ncbi:MAG: protein O-mannosyl-transferase family [Planctomycetota bacterium]